VKLHLEGLEDRTLMTGTWTALNNLAPTPDGIGTMMLLTDGTVMAEGGNVDRTWYKLTPDSAGSYANGAWSSRASMSVQRLYFGSNVLTDGRVFVVGGEYSSDGGFSRTGEIYDPVTNTWTNTANFLQSAFGDDPTTLLPDGSVLGGYVSGPQTYIYHPTTNTWTQTGTKLRNDQSDEETWIKLPDDSILSYDVFSTIGTGVGHAQRYIPSTGTWIDASLGAPNNLTSTSVGYELGPALLLPDGRVFQLGATSHTAYYTPLTNSWTAGPDIPNGFGADDAPAAIMPNGKILFAADHPLFNGPTRIFEFDPTANTYTDVTPPSSIVNESFASYINRMLVLPTGQVLLTCPGPSGSARLAIYTPDGSASSAWKPTISSIIDNGDGTSTLTGTQLTGLSEGASYGDDAEMSSNYPLIRFVDSANHVFYARTFNWSSTGVATGNTPETVKFIMPSGMVGAWSLTVIANGIASDPFVPGPPKLSPDSPLPQDTVGIAYNQTIKASGGNGNKTLTVTNVAGAIPGLVVPTSGTNTLAISGTPTAAGTETFTVTATDQAGAQAVVNYSVTVNPVISLTPPTPLADTINIAYNQTITALGGTGMKTLVVSNVQNPIPNLALTTNGSTTVTITGTPLVTGVETFTITVTDAVGARTVVNYALVINPHVRLVPTPPLADTIGIAYNQAIFALDGTGDKTLAVSNIVGAIPGLTVPSSGVNSLTITGTPTATGTETFTVTATDAVGDVSVVAYSLTVNPAVTIVTPSLPPGTAGFTYSQALVTGGGTGNKTLTISNISGAIPGLVVPATATNFLIISGIPTAPGTETFTLTVTDTVGATATANYSITINPAIVLNPAALQGDDTGFAYSQTITATGGTGDKTLTVSNVQAAIPGIVLPSGGTNSITITGTPTATGTETFIVTAMDSIGAQSQVSYSIVVNSTITFSPASLPPDTINTPYNKTITASDGTGDKQLTVSNVVGAIPGLIVPASSVNTLTITGTPTATGTETFTVTAVDVPGISMSKTYSITVNPAIQISPPTLAADTINIPYSQTITATGGTGDKSLAVSNIAGAIPGLVVPSGGTTTLAITGTPTASGTETFTVTATDAAGGTTTTNYSIVVNPAIAFSPTTLAQDTANVAYNQAITAVFGTGNKTLSVSNIQNAVPGLNVPAGGTNTLTITGTPTAAGTETFTLNATDSVGSTTSGNFSIVVNPAASLAPATVAGDTVGFAYNQTITGTGGTGDKTLTVSNIQNAISGLNVPSTGTNSLTLSGTPTATGTETFTVTVTDSLGSTTSANYSILVNPPVSLTPTSLPAGTANNSYNHALTTNNGTGTKTFTVSNIAGAIPGLNVPASATNALNITGTPTTSGSETFTVTVTDAVGSTASGNYSITINPAITLTPSLLPDDTINIAYNQTITAAGGTGDKTLAVNVTGAIPGLVVPASGTNSLAISGTPTAAGVEAFTVTATDSIGATAVVNYSITVNPRVTIGPSTLAADTINIAYNQTITATGGTGNKTLTISNITSAIPGLVVPASGTNSLAITGTPTAAGTETFTITAVDSLGSTTSTTLSIVVNPAVTFSPATLPADTVNAAYNRTITAIGGTGNKTLTISNIANPIPGLVLPASGTNSLTITGTPTSTGTVSFTVNSVDAVGSTSTTSYSIVVNPGITFSPGTLPPDTAGFGYNQTISTSGGTGNRTLTVSNIQNAIPGLVVPASGTNSLTLSGAPAVAGTETFTVTATDEAGGTTVANYSVTVNPPISLSPSTLPADTVNFGYNQTITATGGTGNKTLTVSNIQNAIPGLNIPATANGSLTISGTPTAAGTETFTVTGTDSIGATTSIVYHLTVNPPLVITTTTLASYWTEGVPGYSQTINTTGGTSPITFSVPALTPPGITLSSSGVLSGTPTATGVYDFTVTATDVFGAAARQRYTVIIIPPEFSYDPTSKTVTVTTSAFGYSKVTTADGSGLHSTYNLNADGRVQPFPDTVMSLAIVHGQGGRATLTTNDTYVGTDGATHETAERMIIGNGGGKLQNLGGQDLVQLSGFNAVYAVAGHADQGSIIGTPGVLNVFVGSGIYAYMNSGNSFYYVTGAQYVYGYAANSYDIAFNYDGSGPSTYVSSGIAYNYMVGTDQGQSFFNEGVGFRLNEGVARHGGDVAYIFDSPQSDTFKGGTQYSYLYIQNASGGYDEYDAVAGFAHVYAMSFVGGTDYAYVYDPVVNTVVGFVLLT
jgi:hypothetical protein